MRYLHLTILAFVPLVLTQSPLTPAPSGAIATVSPVPSPSAGTTTPPVIAPPTEPSAPTTASPPISVSEPITVSEPASVPASEPVSANITTIPPSSTPSANVSSLPSMSANVTSSGISPNATSNATTFNDPTDGFFGDEGDDALLGDVELDLGVPALQADEQVLTLAYMANLNQSSCINLANQYATGASPDLRRHYADLEYARRKRKRQNLSKRCLAAAYKIPTFIHWVLPPSATPDKWISLSRFESQMKMAEVKLKTIGAVVDIQNQYYWDGPNARKFSSFEWTHTSPEYLAFIANAKKQVDGVGSRNLHIFLVQDMGGPGGRANFPGKAALAKAADCVVMLRARLPNAGKGADDTGWGTFPHETGHWLGLIHLHDGGPGSTGDGCSNKGDLVAGTARYRNGKAYSETCDKVNMGTDGLYETNIMSYAKGRTFGQARFLPEQRIRAIVGWLIRRDGLTGTNSDIRRVYTAKDCDTGAKKLGSRSTRIDSLHPDSVVGPHKRELTIRQTANELQRYCQNTDLTIADHDFSPVSEGGIYNPASVPFPGDNSRSPPEIQAGPKVEVKGAPLGSNFDQVKQEVQARVESGGKVDQPYVTPAAVTVTAAPTGGSGGNGKSGAVRQAGWAGVGMAVMGLIIGGLMVF